MFILCSMKSFSPIYFIIGIFLVASISCKQHALQIGESGFVTYYPSSKPCTRWWWFATEIKYQLDWMKEMNFGGVEIAWVYPLYRYQKMYADKYNRHYPIDTSAQKWLGPE